MADIFLLTGGPGSGKTTIVREAISQPGVSAGGFYTEEIRAAGVRKGFTISTLNGREAILAHVDFHTSYRVGKYGVDISVLDTIGVSALEEAAAGGDFIVIDEIGRMELLSQKFKNAVWRILLSPSRVLGTIMSASHPFADKVKAIEGIRLREVNAGNRSRILEEVHLWLRHFQ